MIIITLNTSLLLQLLLMILNLHVMNKLFLDIHSPTWGGVLEIKSWEIILIIKIADL